MKGEGYNHQNIQQALHDYCLGLLPDDEELRVEQHLMECAACHARAAEMLAFARIVRANPAAFTPALRPAASPLGFFSRMWTWHPGLVAAAATLLLLAVPFGALRYVAGVQHDRYDLDLPRMDVMKSADLQHDQFQSGVQAFEQKQYEHALRHFTGYLKHEPDNFDANFFSGLCYLELSKQGAAGVTVGLDRERARQGIAHLEKARAIAGSLEEKTGNTRYRADAVYYLGKAYYLIGDFGQARGLFQQYLAMDEPLLGHRDEVRALLRGLPR